MDLRLFLEKQFDTAVQKQQTEDICDPRKTTDEPDTDKNENRPHNQRANNSPKQHAMLMLRRHFKKPENQQENEQIIDAKRELDVVPGNKLQCGCTAVPEKDNHRK